MITNRKLYVSILVGTMFFFGYTTTSEGDVPLETKTPLTQAAERNDVQEVQNLLQQGADVNAQDPGTLQWTALTIAAKRGNFDVAHLLVLDPGINTNINQLAGPLILSALGYAAQEGHDEMVNLLVHEGGADVNTPNDAPPLIEAVTSYNEDVVDLLLKAGANPNLQRPENGRTAVSFAAENGDITLVDRLSQAGANLDQPDHHHRTPIIHALLGDNISTADLLLRKGASAPTRTQIERIWGRLSDASKHFIHTYLEMD